MGCEKETRNNAAIWMVNSKKVADSGTLVKVQYRCTIVKSVLRRNTVTCIRIEQNLCCGGRISFPDFL
jgi:hypothetical protein